MTTGDDALSPEARKLQKQILKLTRIGDGYQAQLRTLNHELEEANHRLSQALAEVRTLRGLIPICARCKKIRSDSGFWEQIDAYLARHSEAVFTHGVCPDCAPLLFPRAGAEARPPAAPAGPASPEAEALARRLEALKAEPSFRDHPLFRELEGLAKDHLATIRRMEKIGRISDAYQTQLKTLTDSFQASSRTDALTGLLNRRAMVQALAAELNRSTRENRALSVIMVDADRFKAVNDSCGHQAGDLVLQSLAKALTAPLRGYDLCARWGGEEFLVLLPSTGLPGAAEAAEKLRQQVEACATAHEGEDIRVTVSLGAATLKPGEDIDGLLQRADRAMYDAKRLGGNQVGVHPG